MLLLFQFIVEEVIATDRILIIVIVVVVVVVVVVVIIVIIIDEWDIRVIRVTLVIVKITIEWIIFGIIVIGMLLSARSALAIQILLQSFGLRLGDGLSRGRDLGSLRALALGLSSRDAFQQPYSAIQPHSDQLMLA